MQRLIDWLEGTPVGVFDAAWTLMSWNRLYAELLGDPSGLAERDRNVVWQHFTGQVGRVTHTPERARSFEAAVVADLRATSARYPVDVGLRALLTELRDVSARFGHLWDSHVVGAHTTQTKTVHHPDVGTLELDCDVLAVPSGDLRVVVYSSAPNTEAAEKLGFLRGLGTPWTT
ncbi:hypothetical protein EF847_00185 [Actinobacteria bacterium YIM 96077]|uniref:MmyB-like transcription regulator ligand binding domain-containing protein n=1 Tax=Phytoactinopolyspora halophila TaxID=1981511 RepID=A0A329QSN0_9ACTN|nr:hypothetical protein EF847_00185 [Actinobacteria bacterium YIM 96077]RAW14679.1 hypothetical protein DPM12_10485 [Phytoactinopolyspora halophila]